ncbi:predicted protein [Pediculus humanus corporis]|uniref:Predicted protein n=1 Tax=Pediculus humanus subsp. corporis TaxID=121224 RepID=E0VIL1_PEDHC|nr:uncharacterized protein Phum_PHUM228740 [Pediculus humanus corporis]EEB13217.1 predicted protein [Pediculus humanus corporis]
MPPGNKDNKRKRKVETNLNDEEYRRKRDKNNLAVKRSRDKTKQRTKQTLDRVNQLKSENETLEEKIKLLTKELSFLKNLFLAHAGSNNGIDLRDINLTALLQENEEASSAALKELINNSNLEGNKS